MTMKNTDLSLEKFKQFHLNPHVGGSCLSSAINFQLKTMQTAVPGSTGKIRTFRIHALHTRDCGVGGRSVLCQIFSKLIED